jgi:GWxTD domain-containing protein
MNRILNISGLRIALGIISACSVVVSCKSTQKAAVDTRDVSYLYNPTRSTIKPRFNILNQSDEASVLSVKFYMSDLFFSQANPQNIPLAQLLVTAKLFNRTGGMLLADTSYQEVNIVKNDKITDYITKLNLKVQQGNEYIVEVKILDRLRMEVIQSFIAFNTLTETNKYNFYARGHFVKNELFNPVIRVNEFVNLVYPRKHVDSLFISYYKPITAVPYPPSMLLPERTIDYDPDTTVALAYSDTLPIMFPKPGVYLCSVDRKVDEGFTFFNFGDTYPNMTKPEVMIEPLAYLATEDEMNAMRSAARPKVALDEFWIGCGGNVEKSRELIRIFYTRILYANYYFTSYKEGWRTERGMIYTIYGPPDKLYKSPDGESWGYRKPVIKSSWGGRYHLKEEYLYFNFRVRSGKFSDNDYYLSRSETLISFWDRAVASWRKGIVFRLDNPEDL